MGEYVKNRELYDYDNAPTAEQRSGFRSVINPVSNMDSTDKILLAAYEAANVADWNQTQQISRNPEQMAEASIPKGGLSGVIGTHPSRDKVNAVMGGQAIAVPYLANQLPSGWRKALLGALLLSKGATVDYNSKSGLKSGLEIGKW